MFKLNARNSVRAGAALVGAAALVVAFASTASAHSPAKSSPKPAKPTIVLVHGAWEDGSSFSAVTEELQAEGYTVDVPAIPLRGLASDSAYLTTYLEQLTTGPVILVGHSYGGSVITNAALADPEVKALVYVDAFIPAQGESIASIVGGSTSALNVADPTTVYNLVALSDGTTDVYLKPATLDNDLANGLSSREKALLVSTQRPIAFGAVAETSGVPAWKTLPSWDVVGTQDEVIPEATQLSEAKRAGSHVSLVNAPHLSQISNPTAVTLVIDKAASSVN
jgi:pimeloyl-ACP methyl ester carboxylesterase